MQILSAVAIATLALIASPAFADPAGLAACPKVAEELPELLASAMHGLPRDGEVNATFEVDAQGAVQSITLQGSRQYQSRVRTALESLECHGGTPHRYILKIRFAVPAPPATITAASSPQIAGTMR